MAFSLHETTIGTYVQILEASESVLAKGKAHFDAKGVDLDEALEYRLIEDMMPLRFQINAVAFHSLKAIQGAMAGLFSPTPAEHRDFVGLQSLLAEVRVDLEAISPEAVDSLVGKEVVFRMGERSMPFTAEGFLLTFSLPNFYFHATTMYDILRMKGVPIGKQDFLGKMRMMP